MGLYRKKHLTEIFPYKRGMEDGFECYSIDGMFIGFFPKGSALPRANQIPVITTLEGNHKISEGDYIATGIKGERWPIKPDILAMTYDEVKFDDNGNEI